MTRGATSPQKEAARARDHAFSPPLLPFYLSSSSKPPSARPAAAAAAMSMPFLSRLVPRFPPYPGPHTVSSFELEIPIASLPPSPQPAHAATIKTVQFRVFYPTAATSAPKDAPEPKPEGERSEEEAEASEKGELAAAGKNRATKTRSWLGFLGGARKESSPPQEELLPKPVRW